MSSTEKAKELSVLLLCYINMSHHDFPWVHVLYGSLTSKLRSCNCTVFAPFS